MGRGRAKAKQAKVARQLKYNTPEMDLERLQRELSSSSSSLDDDRWTSHDESYPGEEDDWEDWGKASRGSK